jgi:prepilin-type N-terminal cleavage/methylation domain-containing protein
MNTSRKARHGFTVLELMIVVAIIGLLAALVIMGIARARARAAQTLCVGNLRQIETAKAQWAMDYRKGQGVQPDDTDLFGPTAYIRSKPKCPMSGTYDLERVKDPPTCTVTGHTLN